MTVVHLLGRKVARICLAMIVRSPAGVLAALERHAFLRDAAHRGAA
jgi:hypothetical protein